MKRRAFGSVRLIPILGMCMLSACATVDLSQVSLEKSEQLSPLQPLQNVVEKASLNMTALFISKGWCKDMAAKPTQTATSVLLNGRIKEDMTAIPVNVMGSRQLTEDINLAELHISQTTKAAEIYLATADEVSELGAELSLLESALLSAKEAENNFERTLQVMPSGIDKTDYQALKISIDQLKKITDEYGVRMRGQIASKSNRTRS